MAPIHSFLCGTLSVLASLRLVSALPRSNPNTYVKRQTSSISSTYDYIIVGGGTSGLTVADRLTEDPTKTVLVVEFGEIDNGWDVLLPYNANNLNFMDLFNITSVPQPGLDDRDYIVLAGAVVGGGSAVNGMFFDRGSADDYNAWELLGNPGWGFNGLYPYFQKSCTLTPPPASVEAEYHFTYNTADYGTGPVQASFPPWQWPEVPIMWQGMNELGVPFQAEGGTNGDAVGSYWAPESANPTNYTRSYAKTAHYDPVSYRTNYDLLVLHYVSGIVFDGTTATGVKIVSREDGSEVTVSASMEVILAAGAVHTPQILLLSGVGPSEELQSLDIDVVVDLPGVGMNFQDHPAMYLVFEFANDTTPNPEMLTEGSAYYNASWAQYLANHTGPLTEAHGDSVSFLPLSTIDSNFVQYGINITKQNATEYLPAQYGSDESLLSGFMAQRAILIERFLTNTSAVMELPFGGGSVQAVALEKPLSRGTITINTTDPSANPVVDYGTFVNPIDAYMSAAMLNFTRKWMATPSMQKLGPVELVPGASYSSTDEIISVLRASVMEPTFAHPSCSCPMMPLRFGGVVSPELLVYGTSNLSIIDASIIPLIPATHLQSTVYAVAEKAADIIKARA